MKLEQVWKTIKDDLEVELTKGEFNSFITQLSLSSLTESDGSVQATIAAPTSFHRRVVEKRFWQQIHDAFCRVVGKEVNLAFSHLPGKPPPTADAAGYGPLFSHVEEDKLTYNRVVQEAQLRRDFTFEQFAVSSTNEMAYAAAQAVSKNPGKAYQLLFLYGGVGVGKTHLMQAIGHRILERDPTDKVMYLSGEDFTNEIIEAIQFKSTVEFRKKYRPMDVLLIDDIQFIGGKDRVQEEFFHTFNAVHRAGGQIVLTSDQLPHEIVGLEARLRSRFEGGLTIDIQEPSFELRTAILLIKAKNLNLELPMEVAQLAAANVRSTRGLEGLLARLMVESSTRREPVTIEMVERVLGSASKEAKGDKSQKLSVPASEVLKVVAGVFSVKVVALKGKRRKREIVMPRHLAMYLLRLDLKKPLEEIGVLLGGRDHTTVMHAVDKVTTSLPSDERMRGALVEVRKRLRMKIES